MLQFLSGLHLGSQIFQKNVRIVDLAIFAAQFCPDRQISLGLEKGLYRCFELRPPQKNTILAYNPIVNV